MSFASSLARPAEAVGRLRVRAGPPRGPRTSQAGGGGERRDQRLHAPGLVQQRAQVLVEQRAGQARAQRLQRRGQVRAVEELRVLKARAQHGLVTCAAGGAVTAPRREARAPAARQAQRPNAGPGARGPSCAWRHGLSCHAQLVDGRRGAARAARERPFRPCAARGEAEGRGARSRGAEGQRRTRAHCRHVHRAVGHRDERGQQPAARVAHREVTLVLPHDGYQYLPARARGGASCTARTPRLRQPGTRHPDLQQRSAHLPTASRKACEPHRSSRPCRAGQARARARGALQRIL
jgi:hypothetical protein